MSPILRGFTRGKQKSAHGQPYKTGAEKYKLTQNDTLDSRVGNSILPRPGNKKGGIAAPFPKSDYDRSLEAEQARIPVAMETFATEHGFHNARTLDVETGVVFIRHADTAMHLDGLIGHEVREV